MDIRYYLLYGDKSVNSLEVRIMDFDSLDEAVDEAKKEKYLDKKWYIFSDLAEEQGILLSSDMIESYKSVYNNNYLSTFIISIFLFILAVLTVTVIAYLLITG